MNIHHYFMYRFSVWIFVSLSVGFAQGSITGNISASEVNGLTVIACYADAELGCNKSLSSTTQITTSGSSATYQFQNLVAGQYIVFLWQDSNGNGELEEDLDGISYYTTTSEEVTLVSPPAQNINFNLTGAAMPTATNPIGNTGTSTPSMPELVGSWSTTSYFGDYVDANTGAYAGDSQTAHGVTFNADGTYNMVDYYNIDFNCKWFRLQGTYQVQAEKIILQTQNYEISECGKPFVAQPNETREYLWRFMQYDDGMKLELLSVNSYRDDQDWFYANRYSSVEGEE